MTDNLVERLDMANMTTHPMTLVIVAREAASRIEDQQKRIEELKLALREIADTHIPDQPAAAYGDGEYWAREQHTELRRIALAALGEIKGV
jgi:hypothetical protein